MRVTVLDQSGAIIPGCARHAAAGRCRRARPRSGRPTSVAKPSSRICHRGATRSAASSPGSSSPDRGPAAADGRTRRELRLPIARHAEDVQVGQDGRERALDPRSGAFATVLSKDQIDALPDDPDEMEAALKEMAGPGAVIRVDGFRGGKLPPKSQIRGIRFRRDSFAAENHGGGLVFVDIMTSPGAGPLRGTADFTFRDESLNARNAFSPERSPEQQQNYGFTLNGTLVKNRTSFSLTSNGTNSYDSQTIYAVTASRHRRRRGPTANRPRQFVGARRSRVDEGLLVEGNVSAGDGGHRQPRRRRLQPRAAGGTPGELKKTCSGPR